MCKRVLSIWLSVCMVLIMLPISAMAEEESTPASASGEVIAFAPLAETEKSVEVGTPLEKLKLPEKLTATVRTAVPADSVIPEEPVLDSGESEDDVPPTDPTVATTTSAIKESENDQQESPASEWKETTVDIPVIWTAEPEYDGNENGDYVFTPVIEDYTVSADVPEITVKVGAKPLMMALRGGIPTTYGDFSVSIEEDGAAPTYSDGVLIFDTAGEYTVSMADDKTSTSNVIVVSASDVTLNLDGVTIEAPDGSAAKVDGGNALTVTSDSVILNLLNDSSFTGGIGGIVDPMNACNGGSGISGNVTLTGTATLTATGGIGGAAALGTSGTGGAGISGNVTITGAAALTATGGIGGAAALGASGIGGSGISGSLTVTDYATVSLEGGLSSSTSGSALTGTLTATGFIIKGGYFSEMDVITSSDSRLNQFRYLSVEPVPNVAEIGSTGYPTLQAAVDAVDEGQTIKLTDAITVTDSSSITINGAYSFTLDLNGKTLDGGSSGSAAPIKHNGSGTLTIKDSGTGGKITNSRSVGVNSGTIELSVGNGNLTLISGKIENSATNGAGIYNNGTGTVSIQGGVVKASCGVCNKRGNVSVSGGVIEANGYLSAAIVSSAGKVTLSGGIIYNPTYVGIGLSNSSLFISGGSPIIQGGVAAMNAAPSVDSDTVAKVIASTNYDGSNPVENYNASQITSYKYLTFVVKVAPTAAEYAEDAVSGTDYVLDSTNKTLTIKTDKGAAFWSASGTAYLGYTVLLANDIDVPDFLWTAVGNGSGDPFEGSFDGHEHSITGLTVTAANSTYAGLFGGTKGATIQNLCVLGTIEVSETDSPLYIGGIVGVMGDDSTIRNCCSHVAIRGAASGGDEINAGGIVGLLNSGTIENCFNTGNVSGSDADMVISGGIYGAISQYDSNIGTVKNSYNTGSVSGSGSSITFLGALGGAVDRKIVLENCYYLSGAASAAFGSGSSANVRSFTAGTTDTLLASLHSWVSGQASTLYRTWQADANSINGGYPVFGDLWGTTTPDKLPTGGDNGGGSGNGGGASGSSTTPSPATKPTEPVSGSTENKATVDNKGNANVSLTDKNITDAIADAKAIAAKKGVNAGDITAVIHVTTDGKDASTVTVNLPKTTQEQVIGNRIASVQLVIDRPDLTLGINLAAVTEINRQAQADVQLLATRMDNSKLSGDAKAAIGNRPTFDFKSTYGNGKSVNDFGKGIVSVEIPYTLQKGEVAGNICAVYVDSKGKVTYLTDSSYDAKRGTVVFSTSHFSTYGIAYKASFNFTDISGHWAKDDILFVANRGLMTGTGTSTFSPNGSMTRGMFVTALGRLANVDISTYKKSSFRDVRTDAYYMGYIEWGVKNNILVGIGGGKFDPDGLVTREQMALMMDRYATAIAFKLSEAHAQNTFADNTKIGAWAAPSVKRIQMAGIIQGKNNNFYDPQGTATRAEASAVLRRFVELMIFSDTAQGWVKTK